MPAAIIDLNSDKNIEKFAKDIVKDLPNREEALAWAEFLHAKILRHIEEVYPPDFS